MLKFAPLLLVTALCHGQLQLGEVISVDFGTTVPSGNYNVINSGTLFVGSLIRLSDGAATNVSLSVTATTPFDNASDVAPSSTVLNTNDTDADVYGDGFLSTNGNNGSGNDIITLTFTGLDDTLYYDLSGGFPHHAKQRSGLL